MTSRHAGERAETHPKAPLSRVELHELQRALELKRAQLLRAHEERERQALEAPESGGADLEDIAEGVIEDRQRAALENHDRTMLQEIEHALQKIDAGTYGLSEATGHPIPLARLRALPWARS